MSEEKYILAELKRRLVMNSKEFVYAYEILVLLAEIEAKMVLGAEELEQEEKEAE